MEVTNSFASINPSTATDFSLTGESSALDKDDFLTLLVTQLSNQDPLNPMEGQEFAAQLAQFSSLESLINIQDTLETNNELSGLMAETYNSGIAAGLIGNTVEAYSDTVDWPGSGAVTLGVDMTNAAENVSIAIKDEGGTVVRTIEVGALEKGPETIEWDGTDDNGAVVGAGVYTLEVTATDADEVPIEALPFIQATVDRVTFTAGGITLWMGDAEIPMTSVFSIQGSDD